MGKRKSKQIRLQDVYQADDSDAEEDKQAGQRYDNVANFQYELPEDFEDEEIDEEMAFTEEDKQLMAKKGGGLAAKRGGGVAEDGLRVEEQEVPEEELTRDDFSDDDSEADRLYGPAGGARSGAGGDQSSDSGADSDPDLGGDSEADEGEEGEAGEGGSGGGGSDVDAIFEGVSDDEELEEGGYDSQGEGEDLEAVGRAVGEALGSKGRGRGRRAAEVMDEAVPESQYNLSAGTGELSLADLLAGLGPRSGKQSKAHKQLAQLAKKAQPVAAPLPGPIRARKERQAGYEDTKKNVTKWTPLVRANREAPTLVFTAPRNDVPRTTTTAALTSKFQPSGGGMEAEVAAMLQAAGVTADRGVEEAEEALALQALSAEEVAKRRDELAKMRSLLFKHEEKSRHLAKIKSKDYHRRLKKSARHKAEKDGELGDQDFIRLQAEKAEYERAKERLTLKHKNTSQWARRALKRGVDGHDDGKKEALAEQLRLGQELRRRVDRADAVEGSDEDGSDAGTDASSSDSESEGEGGGARVGRQKVGRKAAAKLQATAACILDEGMEDDDVSKGLFSLPFMRRAQQKRKLAAEKEARQLLAELDGQSAPLEAPSSGRRNFGLQGGVQANDGGEEPISGDDSGSDVDEDRQAKQERLARVARGFAGGGVSTRGDSAAKPRHSKKQRTQELQEDSAAAEFPQDEEWGHSRANTATTGGPIDVESPLEGLILPATEDGRANGLQDSEGDEGTEAEEAEGGVLSRTAGMQNSLHSRTQLLATPAGKKGSKRGRGEGSDTPASGPAAAGQERAGKKSRGASEAAFTPSDSVAAGNAELPAFVKAKTFSGAKPGYAFGRGKQGVGYYLDKAAETAAASQPQPKQPKAAGGQKTAGQEIDAQAAIADAATLGVDDEGEGTQAGLRADGASQQELIARAFAGDDVAAEFEAEKEAEAEAEGPKVEVPSQLPGWGAWASLQKEPKWLAAAKAKAEKQKQAAKAGRKDARLRAVSITERWDKKAAKYSAPTLPYPFTSKQAFEGSLRQPLGPDFNTQTSFKEMTRPGIIKASGVVIQPLKFSQGAAQEQKRVHQTPNAARGAVARVSGGMSQPQKKRRK